jgi:hypothetical protein
MGTVDRSVAAGMLRDLSVGSPPATMHRMSGQRVTLGRAVTRIVDVLDRPFPERLWPVLVVVASAVSVVRVAGAGGTFLAFDWGLYSAGRRLWFLTGSPYVVPPPGWDPSNTYPYIYPPSSWPLLLLSLLPWPVVLLGLVPIARTSPRLGPAFPAFVLCLVAIGPTIFLCNVNLLIAGLIVIAFRPGAVGGLALGAASAVKAYTIALLPLLWGDRRRLAWTLGVLAALAVSGTVIFGIGSGVDFLTALVREGPYPPDMVFNPLTVLGPGRIVAAIALAVVGIAVGSPTLTLVGATWVSAGTTVHYLVTFVAALCVEPPIRGRDLPIRRFLDRRRPLADAEGPRRSDGPSRHEPDREEERVDLAGKPPRDRE